MNKDHSPQDEIFCENIDSYARFIELCGTEEQFSLSREMMAECKYDAIIALGLQVRHKQLNDHILDINSSDCIRSNIRELAEKQQEISKYASIFNDWHLACAVSSYLIHNFPKDDEDYMQRHFLDNCNKYIPNSKLLWTGKVSHGADGMLEIDGKQAVVEVKRNIFSKAALIQLQRYMKKYDTKIGVAVAKRCLVELPKNIIFVGINLTP